MNKKVAIYVVDHDDCLLYANQIVHELYPNVKIGEKCYTAFSHQQKCKTCPRHNNNNVTCHYDKQNHRHIVRLTSHIEWLGKSADLVVMYASDSQSKTSFDEAIKYDLLLEIDLDNQLYKVLYDNTILIGPSLKQGTLTQLNEYAANAVHAEDFLIVEHFQQFDNTGDTYLMMSTQNNYRWVRQWQLRLELPNENKYLMFICDVDQSNSERRNQLNELTNSDINDENGLMSNAQFYSLANRMLLSNNPYWMVSFQINQYEMFNAWYGQTTAKKLISEVAELLKIETKAVTYTDDTGFIGLVVESEEKLESIQTKIKHYYDEIDPNMTFFSLLGVCKEVEDSRTMAEKARLAVDQYVEKGPDIIYYQQNYLAFDNQGTSMIRDVRNGLKNHEFEVVYQPKCHMRTGKVVGFEALVRWNHPTFGLVMPSAFIPVLEKTGLITKLDVYVWEEVIKDLVNLKDVPILPVSINVSVKDIEMMDVLQVILDIINKYQAKPEWIEIEITESVYAENFHQMDDLVKGFQAAKFKVLIDDFGSAYSSLNMLSNINFDILKLDMEFLDLQNDNEQKGLSIIDAIVKMAHWMGLLVIGEGVENQRQRDYLLNVGCEYGQGYYFYRPMSYQKMIEILSDPSKIDRRGIVSERMNTIQPSEFFNPYFVNDATLNKILGAVAFFDEEAGKINVSQVNGEYYRVTNTNPIDFKLTYTDILQYIHEDDREALFETIHQAKHNLVEGSEIVIRHLNKESTLLLRFRIYFLQASQQINYYFAKIERVNHD